MLKSDELVQGVVTVRGDHSIFVSMYLVWSSGLIYVGSGWIMYGFVHFHPCHDQPSKYWEKIRRNPDEIHLETLADLGFRKVVHGWLGWYRVRMVNILLIPHYLHTWDSRICHRSYANCFWQVSLTHSDKTESLDCRVIGSQCESRQQQTSKWLHTRIWHRVSSLRLSLSFVGLCLLLNKTLSWFPLDFPIICRGLRLSLGVSSLDHFRGNRHM